MELYLVDGTYELYRAHFGYPSRVSSKGVEVGALKGYINHLQSLKKNYKFIAVAFDHTVESFRNKMYPGYKSSRDSDQIILNQFPLAEEVTKYLGIKLFSMKKFEADDAIASICFSLKDEKIKIIIGSLDKDLMQCIKDGHIQMYSTRYKKYITSNYVYEKFGIYPFQVPDFLALVGDVSDGFPGIKGVGIKTASTLLEKYKNIENIISNIDKWKHEIRSGEKISEYIKNDIQLLKLFKNLATLRTDVNVPRKVIEYQTMPNNKTKLKMFSDLYSLNLNIKD